GVLAGSGKPPPVPYSAEFHEERTAGGPQRAAQGPDPGASRPRDGRPGSAEGDQGLDDPVVLGGHHLEGRRHVVEGERVRGHRGWVDPPRLHEPEEPGHALVAAGAEAGVDGLVVHAEAEGVERQLQRGWIFAVVADVRHPAARLCHAQARLERLREAERLDGGVDALAAGEIHDLLDWVTVAEVDDVVRAEPLGQRLALRAGLDGDDPARPHQVRAHGRAQPHRALREHRDRLAELEVRVLGAHEPGAEHVAGVDGLGVGEVVGDRREVRERGRDEEVLRHVAVHLDGVLVAAERPAALAGVTALTVVTAVARGHRVDRDALPDLEAGHGRPELFDHADGLVAERAPVRHRQRAFHRVHVRGADQRGRRADDRLLGAWVRDRLLDQAGLADFLDHERAHRIGHGALQGATAALSIFDGSRHGDPNAFSTLGQRSGCDPPSIAGSVWGPRASSWLWTTIHRPAISRQTLVFLTRVNSVPAAVAKVTTK